MRTLTTLLYTFAAVAFLLAAAGYRDRVHVGWLGMLLVAVALAIQLY